MKKFKTKNITFLIIIVTHLFSKGVLYGQATINKCIKIYDKAGVEKYKSLKKNNVVLAQKATNTKDAKGLKQGLWEIQVKHNTHYGFYTCLDTANHSGHIPFKETIKIYAKGNYKDNIPVGVWIKYIKKFDYTYNEYFFFKTGTCIKHIYYDHHNCMYYTDSLNLTGDTIISTGNHYYSTGKKEKFNIDYNWSSRSKEKIVKWIIKEDNYTRIQYYNDNGSSSYSEIYSSSNDTTIISTFDKNGKLLKREKQLK